MWYNNDERTKRRKQTGKQSRQLSEGRTEVNMFKNKRIKPKKKKKLNENKWISQHERITYISNIRCSFIFGNSKKLLFIISQMLLFNPISIHIQGKSVFKQPWGPWECFSQRRKIFALISKNYYNLYQLLNYTENKNSVREIFYILQLSQNIFW